MRQEYISCKMRATKNPGKIFTPAKSVPLKNEIQFFHGEIFPR
jgi:hypothetical protein